MRWRPSSRRVTCNSRNRSKTRMMGCGGSRSRTSMATYCFSAIPGTEVLLRLHEPVARVGVVVDAVLGFDLPDVVEVGLCVRADAVAGVEEDFFEAAGQRHPLVRGEIVEQRGQALFEADGDVDAFDRERRILRLQTLAEDEVVSIEVTDGVLVNVPRLVGRLFEDL